MVPQSTEPNTSSAICRPAPCTYGMTARINPPTTKGAEPSTPRAPRVDIPRAISTCDIQPVSSTTAAPNTHGSTEIQPASVCEKPRPLMMKGVNQVSPSDNAQ